MFDDGHGLARGIALRQPATLAALPRVLERVAVTRKGDADGAETDRHAGLVHQLEHVAEVMPLVSDQLADAGLPIAERQCRDDMAPPAHLVIEPDQRHAVGRADFASGVDPATRQSEQ